MSITSIVASMNSIVIGASGSPENRTTATGGGGAEGADIGRNAIWASGRIAVTTSTPSSGSDAPSKPHDLDGLDAANPHPRNVYLMRALSNRPVPAHARYLGSMVFGATLHATRDNARTGGLPRERAAALATSFIDAGHHGLDLELLRGTGR